MSQNNSCKNYQNMQPRCADSCDLYKQLMALQGKRGLWAKTLWVRWKKTPKNPPKPPTTEHELMHRKPHKPQIHAIQLRAVPQLGRSRKNWRHVIHSLRFWKDQKMNVKTQQSRCSTAQKDKKNKFSSIKFFVGLDKYCNGTFSAYQRARRRGV